MGRPPLPPRERRDYSLKVKITKDERAAIERYAEREVVTLSTAARYLLRKALKRWGK
jgi:hypothetical protein